MVVVAVAGGRGGIGNTIADTLRQSPHHELIVLSRKVSDIIRASDIFVSIDYSDVDSMVKILEDNNVHTVISALAVADVTSSEAETNLVKATNKASTSKRFIVSAWGIQYAVTTLVGQARARSIDELRKSDLEWTQINNGFFLDYYGPPSLKSYMRRVAWSIDMVNKKAGIPGTGDEPMTFTYTFDVARFVVAALDLPSWEEVMYCYGEKTTWNEFLMQAEEARGTKFEVSYDPLEKLQKGEVTSLPSNNDVPDYPKTVLDGLMSFWGLYVMEGRYDIPADKALNKIFPDIKPLKVKDVLGLWRQQ
ncbi:nmra-like family [Fusarium longipes]|uniref:Nmra-like family n=1 Tax=Fusarium longipes TaxID=694270 RepID=A0A395SXD1_9HYPO|nr:nmra-like family [Fusarium longipes]